MTAAATREDLAGLVVAFTEQAETQRKWQAEYEAKAAASRAAANAAMRDWADPRGSWDESNRHRAEQTQHERHAAMARGTANAYEVSADMIRKYVTVVPE